MKRLALLALALCLVVGVMRARRTPPESVYEPPTEKLWTSSRCVSDLQVDADGSLWVATGGPVLRYANGRWTRYESLQGMNILGLQDGQLLTQGHGETYGWDLEKRAWNRVRDFSQNSNERTPGIPGSEPTWQGQHIRITPDALVVTPFVKSSYRITLPSSSGTHFTSALPHGPLLWASIYGDGVWQWNGAKWSKANLNLPEKAKEITALEQSPDGKTVWVGTRREGVWQFSNGRWRQHLQPDEPYANNIQYMQAFRGAVWASTLEDGLVVRDGSGWRHYGNEVMSSNAPRQLCVFQNKLYIRHSNESVDCFDGAKWTKNVFPNLPRKQIIAMAADTKYLYLGQWGGWSRWDGKSFVHHLRIPELQIVPLVQMLPDGDSLWLGTVNRGLFQYSQRQDKITAYDERHGLPDDWITCLARQGNNVYAGTFAGGLAWKNDDDATWQTEPKIGKLNVTAIVSDGSGGAYLGTRYGLYHRDGKNQLANLGALIAPTEIQALLPAPNGLWVGARNAIAYYSYQTLRQRIESAASP